MSSLDGPQLGIAECVYEVSKELKGQLNGIKVNSETCDKLQCITLKTEHELQSEVSSHLCDSAQGKKLDGKIHARIIHGLVNDGKGRGAHYGKFELFSITGIVVNGRMWGITNAGTHHKPVTDCERCDQRGHMEGQTSGRN